MTRQAPRPVVLCILDGFGHRDDRHDNAIALARTPVLDHLMATSPHALLATSGEAVGLPDGQMGNSEVGHMNIGAGRVATQDLPRIDLAIAKGEVAANPVLLDLIAKVRASGGVLHLMGLLSPGGVHSHQDHLTALARIIADHGVPVRLHAFLDGRDTPPRSAEPSLRAVESALADMPGARIATIGGRYFAMDRDKRWDRVERAFATLVRGEGPRFSDAPSALAQAYSAEETDEFVTPRVIGDYAGMRDGDGLLMANFRADRARQILTALVDPAFDGFPALPRIAFAGQAGLVEYSSALNAFLPALFPAIDFADTLGEVVSRAGLKQLRIAETEKYAHVTFFLNGGREDVFAGEDRILVQSPKVATYDLQPEMSAGEVTDRLVDVIDRDLYDLIVVNFANGDMVGHTGNLAAAIAAIETLDRDLGRVLAALRPHGGVMLITADHGNAEMMRDPETGEPHTAHTTFDVPIILAGLDHPVSLTNGKLADVAPTVLDLMGLARPGAMTGHSLIGPARDRPAARPGAASAPPSADRARA